MTAHDLAPAALIDEATTDHSWDCAASVSNRLTCRP